MEMWLDAIIGSQPHHYYHKQFYTEDEELDVDVWRRCDRAVQNSNLIRLTINRGGANNDVLEAERCVDAFFEEVKHSNSIVEASFGLTRGVSILPYPERLPVQSW